MKKAIAATIGAGLFFAAGCGTQNPFGNDAGESTPQEDEAVIVTYTQTVNQASSSQDTTFAPTINGNNNNVTIVYGDGNESDAINTRNPPAEPEAEAVAEEP